VIKKIIKYIVCFILYYSGFVTLIRKIKSKQKLFRILVYHRVGDNCEGSAPFVTSKRFKKQLNYLNEYYRITKLDNIVKLLGQKGDIPDNLVSITFDDGYKDIINNVLSIIEELKVPITVFLTSSCIGANKMLWTDALYFHFKEEKKMRRFYNFKERLKKIDNEERVRILNELGLDYNKGLMLNWQDVLKLIESNNVEIGSHSKTHAILANMDTKETREEILDSKQKIEEQISQKISGFSYPAGKYSEEIKKMVKKAGYQYAYAVNNKINSLDTNLYSLNRITVQNEPLFCFATRLLNLF